MYRVDESIKTKVNELFGKTEQTVEEDIDTIKKWIIEESFHPEIMSDAKIRNMLNLCKFNIDKTKEKINFYYKAKRKYPDMFDNCNPSLPHMKKVATVNNFATHPERLNDLHRIIFLRPKDPKVFIPRDIARLFFCIFELRLENDFMTDDVIVYDMKNVTLKGMTQMTPLLVWKVFAAYKNVFSMRMKATYIVNSPYYVWGMMKIFKLLLKPKLFNRIQVHQDTEILKEVFPDDLLPEEYGGNGFSLNELDEMMKEEFVKCQERFDELDKIRS